MNGIYGEVTVNFSERDRKLFLHISELMERFANAHNSEDLYESDSAQETLFERVKYIKKWCNDHHCEECPLYSCEYKDTILCAINHTNPSDWRV